MKNFIFALALLSVVSLTTEGPVAPVTGISGSCDTYQDLNGKPAKFLGCIRP